MKIAASREWEVYLDVKKEHLSLIAHLKHEVKGGVCFLNLCSGHKQIGVLMVVGLQFLFSTNKFNKQLKILFFQFFPVFSMNIKTRNCLRPHALLILF